MNSNLASGDHLRREIAIDHEVFSELQKLATPLVDDANSVLRRLLGIDGPPDSRTDLRAKAAAPDSASPRVRPKKAPHREPSAARQSRGAPAPEPRLERAPKGSLLPEDAYEVPLLQALIEVGGAGASSEVLDLLGQKLDALLTDLDRETINSGEVRWRNRAQFVRLGLVKKGLMTKNSPRGIWAITDDGRSFIERGRENVE